jgi:PilZ domain-containing protein
MPSSTHAVNSASPSPDARKREAERTEHRSAPRMPASAVPSITALRLSANGGDAVLINISAGGLLAECSERLQMGYRLTVMIEGTFEPKSIRGKVARSSVAALGADGRLRYHVGIAFDTPIRFKQEPVDNREASPTPTEAPTPPPRVEPLRNRW